MFLPDGANHHAGMNAQQVTALHPTSRNIAVSYNTGQTAASKLQKKDAEAVGLLRF